MCVSPPPWQPKVINSISSNLPNHPPTPPTWHHQRLIPLPGNPTDKSPPWQPMAIQFISNDAHPLNQPQEEGSKN